MAKNAATVAKVDLICGIPASKIDAAAVSNALEVAKVKVGGSDSLKKRVEALVKHFKAIADKPKEERPGGVKIVGCDNCGADSTSDLEVCPFCGVGEGDDIGDTPARNAEADAIESALQAEAEAEAAPPEPVVIPEPEAAPPPPSPVPDQKLTQVSGKGSKREKVKETPGAPVLAFPVAGEVVPEGLSPIDKFVWEVKRLQSVTNVSGYMLAKKLSEGEVSGVWKTRLDKKERAAYRNFETFAAIELGMSANYARSLLKMYAQFDEATFLAVPTTKLRLLVEATPEARPKVQEMINRNASRREIEREAMGRKPGEGERRPPGPKAKAPRPEPKTTGKVTLALVEGKHKVTFFDKPAKKGEEPTKKAKTFSETPWARLPIAGNDAEVLLTLRKNAEGVIEGVVEVRRVEPVK